MRRVLSYLTFPGVMVHEFAHAWACRLMGVRVIKVCYLRLGNPAGYVLHARPATVVQHIIIATAPLFISTILSLLISALAGTYSVGATADGYHDSIAAIALWVSLSIALHAFPSSGDADALWSDVKNPHISLVAKFLLVPVVGMIRLAGFGRHLCLDLFFAALVTLAPFLFVMKVLE